MAKNETKIIAEAGKQEVTITREFEAPRGLVFKAWTTAEMYVQWLGPRELKMQLQKFDCFTGGSWRYVSVAPNGMAHGFHGSYHEVTAPERIIQTFEYEGLPEKGHAAMETAKFEALPGNRTRVVLHSVFQSVADRDGMMQSGMSRGVNDSHERLDELFVREQGS